MRATYAGVGSAIAGPAGLRDPEPDEYGGRVWVLARLGVSRTGLVALGALLGAGAIAGAVWREYLVFGDPDWFLMGVWALMALLITVRVDVRRDVAVAVVAFAGGAFIETWGTRSGLWTYFTHQQPPPFILLAWPPAALATDRLSRLAIWASRDLDPGGRRWRWAWRALMGGFLALLAVWTRPAWGHPLTWAAGLAVGLVLATARDHRADVGRFVAGAALGYLLERWGTTRACWTYWSGGTPPLTSVLAHGFATVAFLRVATVLTTRPWSARPTRPRPPGPRRRASRTSVPLPPA